MQIHNKTKMTSKQTSDVPNLVLIIGCRTRNVLGKDGMHPLEGSRLTSDEARVVAMNKVLAPQHARVITLNKQHDQEYKFHTDADVKTVKWVSRFERWLGDNHAGVLQDVYLDYFFFQQSWYRLGYGTKWIEILRVLHFEGNAFLPIPKEPRDGVLDKRDTEYHHKLIDDVIKHGGIFIRDRRQIDRIPWCQATINAHEELLHIDQRMKSPQPYGRNHPSQMARIEGILVISSAKIHAVAQRLTPQPTSSVVVPVTPVAPPTFHVETKIISPRYPTKYLQVTVTPNKDRYKIRFAAALFGTKSRREISFSKNAPFGVGEDFGKHIYRSLRQVVRLWNSKADVSQWFATKSVTFKKRVVARYQKKKERRHRRGPQIMPEAQTNSALVSVGRNTMWSIPLPDFRELRTNKSKLGAVQVIRVGKRLNAMSRNAPITYLYLPGPLLRSGKGAEFSFGTLHGINKEWMKFIAEYTKYAVSKWESFQKARSWTLNHLNTFLTLVQKLWSAEGANVGGCYRSYEIRPSTLPIDEEYVREGWFPPSAGSDPGFGLWCTKAGEHTFVYNVDGVTEIVDCESMTDRQGHYGANVDGDGKQCVVPTLDAFNSRAIPHAFLVQHCRQNPTHKAVYEEESRRALLLPIRPAKVGEEYCFDYKYHTAGAKDYVTKQ